MAQEKNLVLRTQRWAEMLRNTRAFFDDAGFCEVTTNHVVPQGAFESSIDTVKVYDSTDRGELHTSPEIEMKRLLAEVQIPIYQICKCFRDDPATPIHWKEFTMLEFYRLNCTYEVTQKDVRQLLESLAGHKLPFETHTVTEAILRYTGVDISKFREGGSLAEELTQKNILWVSESDTWTDLFFKLLVEKVEPALPPSIPVLLTEYPIEVSPLSNPKIGTRNAERFEVYWHGMELCNGCTELRDPEELKRRHTEEATLRTKAGKTPHSFPSSLYEAMKRLPLSSGVAVGMDRVFLCLEKTS